MGQFSVVHLLLFMFILLIFFGPSRLPALGQSLGKAIKGFKDGLNTDSSENERAQLTENKDIIKQISRDNAEQKS